VNPTELILAFLSIVLALALQEVLQGLGAVIRLRRGRDLPIAQYLFALSVVNQMVLFWWTMWTWRSIPWTIGVFVLMLAGLTLLYLLAFLIFPTEDADDHENYYMDSARRLWILHALFVGVVWAVNVAVIGQSVLRVANMIPLFVFLLLVLVACKSRSRRVHVVLCGLLVALTATALSSLPSLGPRFVRASGLAAATLDSPLRFAAKTHIS
jgi:hypothetical protein